MKTRRQIIAASAGSLLLGLQTAEAAASMSKASVGYRDIPYDGQVCAACVYFVFYPSENGELNSRCKLVAGPINPAGWCQVYAPR